VTLDPEQATPITDAEYESMRGEWEFDRAIRPEIFVKLLRSHMNARAISGGAELPYEVVSLNARAQEWQDPLWSAIHAWATGDLTAREAAVVEVHAAVERAMRLAVGASIR